MGMQPEGLDEECWQQQQGLQQNGQGQQKGQQHHGKKRPKPGLMMKRTPQQKLVAQLNRQRQLYSRLQQEGAKLRGHESTLLRSVAQQSAMLHTLGTVLGEDVMVSLRDSEHHAAGMIQHAAALPHMLLPHNSTTACRTTQGHTAHEAEQPAKNVEELCTLQ